MAACAHDDAREPAQTAGARDAERAQPPAVAMPVVPASTRPSLAVAAPTSVTFGDRVPVRLTYSNPDGEAQKLSGTFRLAITSPDLSGPPAIASWSKGLQGEDGTSGDLVVGARDS